MACGTILQHPTLSANFRTQRILGLDAKEVTDTTAATLTSHVEQPSESTPLDSSLISSHNLANLESATPKPRDAIDLSYPESTAHTTISAQGLLAGTYATAADVPMELYDLILYFLERPRAIDLGDHLGQQEQRNRIVVGKRELSQLALVCHSWARMCQRKIFAVIKLRSFQDFRALLSFASHPHSCISQYVENLEFEADSKTRPWIHNACKEIRPRSTSPERSGSPFLNYEGHYLILNGPSALDVLKRGPHASLPRRQLPGTFSQGIVLLSLWNTELAGLKEVVQLGRKLPSLEELHLWKVQWTDPPSTEAQIYAPLIRRHSGFEKKCAAVQQVEMYACTQAWVVLPLLFLLDNTYAPLYVEDLAAVVNFTQILIDSVEQSVDSTLTTIVSSEQWGYLLTVHTARSHHLTPQLCIVAVPETERHVQRVDVIAFQFVPCENETMRPLSGMADYDWKELDAHVTGLITLRHVIFAFESPKDLATFSKTIAPKMTRLRDSQRLKYALEETDPSTGLTVNWIACSPDNIDEDLTNARRVKAEDLCKLYS